MNICIIHPPYCYNKFNLTQSRHISCKHATHACLYVFADIVVFAPIKCCLPTLIPGERLKVTIHF